MKKDTIREMLSFEDLTPEDKQKRGILGRLYGPCASISVPTRNGRGYNESLWENVFSNEITKEMFANGGIPMELDHPVDREETDSSRIAAMMPEAPKRDKDGHLIAYCDLIDTPLGRIAYQLAKYGFKLGISSRGSGDVITDDDGNEIVDPDTYDFTTFDLVLLPAVKDARLTMTESVDKNMLNLKNALCEDLEKGKKLDGTEYSKDEKKIMSEELEKLGINLKEKECINESCADTITEDIAVHSNVASNTGTEELVNSMTNLLKEKVELENANKELQEKLAVSDSKVSKLTETLNRNRSSIVRLTAMAKDSKKDSEELSKLKEELESKNSKIEELTKELESKKTQDLNESLKLKQLSSAKTKTIKELSENIEKQKQGYETELASLKEDFEKKSTESSKLIEDLNEKVTKTKKLSEDYKAKANEFLGEYIKLRAKLIGVNPNAIKNQLAKNCSAEDVNRVCESLQSYELSVSKMNLNLDRKVRVEVKESVSPSMVNSDDFVDESLLNLAGLKK